MRLWCVPAGRRLRPLSTRAQLAKKRTAEKKLAITVFSFPPDKGNVGTAAYLNVFGSIYRVLQARMSHGWQTHSLLLQPISQLAKRAHSIATGALLHKASIIVVSVNRLSSLELLDSLQGSDANCRLFLAAGPEATGVQCWRHPGEGGGPHQERPQ